ncbi:PREDICTED: uncharacterized protein LOC109219795 [Nicotiana attenuata]|uniref:uncharacterized protein LOC109219795 n=1 Tax=Nicotiana attenuata TaxID=49451 RepID=UPI0009048BEC|nr:PREDICTED: uncharacterized protein LOC109219795 [Nicotiana attenuata]
MAIDDENATSTNENVTATTVTAEIRSHASSDDEFEEGVTVAVTHPLYLAPRDTSGISLISFQLTGTDNYSLWYRSMRIALLGRNKLGIVDGRWPNERFREKYWYQSERCNAIVLSWLMNSVAPSLISGIAYATNAQKVWLDLQERFDKVNDTRCYNLHKETATLCQGTSSISVYYSKLKDLWDESESIIPTPDCDCAKTREFIVHLRKQKVYQFLMGLNDSYSQARSQILMMKPLPTVNQAYAMLMSDESQQTVAASASVLGPPPIMNPNTYESTALYSAKSNSNSRFRKNYNVQCDFCKMKGSPWAGPFAASGFMLIFRRFGCLVTTR